MIEFLSGKVAELSPTYVVMECGGGVGYMASISLTTYSSLEGRSEAKIYIHESIREDAYQLIGFATKSERAAFRLLTSVSGVGASTARVVLSALSASELQSVIMNEDSGALKSVKGIGLKTAERIIVELKDKIGKMDVEERGGEVSAVKVSRTATSAIKEEAQQALEVMGYNKAQVSKVIEKILSENPDRKVEDVIKAAFRLL